MVYQWKIIRFFKRVSSKSRRCLFVFVFGCPHFFFKNHDGEKIVTAKRPFKNDGLEEEFEKGGFLGVFGLVFRGCIMNPIAGHLSKGRSNPHEKKRPLTFRFMIYLEPQGQPFINGCFNWMIPRLYIENSCFTISIHL